MKKWICVMIAAGFLTACGSSKKKTEEMKEAATTEATKNGEKMMGMKKDTGTSTPTIAQEIQCTLAKDVRTIAIQQKGGKGCELVYTKFGQTKTMAESEAGSTYCEKVSQRIKGNLETAGFNCQ